MTVHRHAELGASKTERWTHCPGSVRLCRGLPDVDTPYAAEGRRAHALAENWLTDSGRTVTSDGDEMITAVTQYVEYVRALAKGRRLRVEVTFDLSPLQPPQEMFGTADAVITGGRRLDVVDFKYGAGVVVEVEENAQLLYYVVGALVSLWEKHHAGTTFSDPVSPSAVMVWALSQFDEMWVHIVQPRAPHPDGPARSWRVTPDRVLEFVAHLMLKAGATLDPDAPLHAGTWCKFCPAQAFCPEVKRFAIEVARTDFSVDPPAAETLPIEVVASVLTKASVLQHWLTALEARAVAELEAGRPVPGWKLVTKRPKRVWNDPAALLEWYRGPKSDLYADAPLKSPAQVEQVVGKKNLLPELYSYVSSGFALAPEHDRRPAVSVGPQQDFPALPPGTAAGPSAEEQDA
jgi:uncharacterized protein DUF2800